MIFYFSCTGNTRWAAETIAAAIGEKMANMADEKHHFRLESDERIGFCFPVHGWRPPKLVLDFISRLVIDSDETEKVNHFCWALCTAGDDIGLTMEYLNRALSYIGWNAESFYSLIMPESYVGLPFMDVDNPEKESNKKRKAEQLLETYISEIRRRQRGSIKIHKGHWPTINSRILGKLFLKFLVTDKPFHVSENCIKCGRCADFCPVKNIRGGRGNIPKWLHNGRCLSCFACYHHCPVHAIRYGRRTDGKGQYFYGSKNNDHKDC